MTTTFREWGSRWLEQRELEGLRSFDRLRWHWTCHLLEAPFVDRPLDEIRRSDVRAFLLSRTTRRARHARITRGGGRETIETERAIARTTVIHIAGTLHSVFAAALDEEVIAANPAAGLRLRISGARPSWTFLTKSEVERIESASELCEERRTIYLAATYTGLRKGELWGLRWQDVHLDPERPYLVVARSLDGPTKTGRIEPVPLIGRARVLFERWRELTGADTELVFPWRGGRRHGRMRGRYSTAGWADYWARGELRPGWSSKLGITRRVRFHDLRHTAASHLLMGTWGRRWSLMEVRDFLRHRSVRETERYAQVAVYVTVDEDESRPALVH